MFDCELRLAHGRDLLHDEAAGVVDPFDEVGARVVEREGDDGGGTRERRGERVQPARRHRARAPRSELWPAVGRARSLGARTAGSWSAMRLAIDRASALMAST